ncbi:asparagine synthase (glutamine-hydrolyzing) [Nitratiruptor sp. YY09-18]|uniref:asparagine synthase (glutamine-hydrolyzing) n=1 Tax=Nitratiruptor sp. YY09-18 TaxID=2724901 RepID=UPI001914F1DE|nr:asparagine synthase (glutamine-hydrolyzing) [Nitratiruptor sp. YY09-18]BCD68779.1 asparagine synthase (glutamine-hydrolysing) [Nitratiruptor sp. YY09-18]
MCAIFGVIGEYNLQHARKALDSLVHRGPDGRGEYIDERVYLGHNRLYIFDRGAKQPVKDAKSVALFNGEIYNYASFGAKNDTEVLLLAPIEKLQGMYAVAKLAGNHLYLAKDFFGKKPLYYYCDGKSFIFASEIKAIITYLGKYEYNPKALSGYLSFGALPDKTTFYSNIYKLVGGQVLVLDIHSLQYTLKRSFSLPSTSQDSLQTLIEKSVAQRLQGDFEVAALLSGGVDSSLVSALAKRAQGRLHTYSIGYHEGRYSELPYAKEVAEFIGSEHHEIIMSEDNFWQTLERVFAHFDEPVGDSATIPLWFLFERINEDDWRVVLSGEGGDEIFLGYRQYFEFADLYKGRDLKYKNWLKNYFRSHFSPNKEWEWYKRVFSGEIVFRGTNEVFTDLQKNLFLRQNVKDGDSLEFLQDILALVSEEDLFTFFTSVDLRTRLEALYLHKLDMASMAHSIEARTPLLDKDILAAALTNSQRSKAPKYLLKQIAQNFITRSIIERKKRGFSYPWLEWCRRKNIDVELVKINREAGFFKPEQLQFLIENAKRNRFTRHYWLVFAFLYWWKRRFL